MGRASVLQRYQFIQLDGGGFYVVHSCADLCLCGGLWVGDGERTSWHTGLAAEAAGQAAMAYAGGTLAINGGPITEVQSGWMASVGWTPSGVGNGVSTGAPCNNPHCNGLYTAVTARHITTDPLDTNNLKGVTKITQGNCPTNISIQACREAGMDPGVTLYRTDSYMEAKSVMIMRQREKVCKAKGLTGQAMRQCIAPPIKDPNHPFD